MHYGKSSSDGSLISDGYLVRLRYIAPNVYVRAGWNYWYRVLRAAGSDVDVDRLDNRWVKLSPRAASGDLGVFAIRTRFLDSLGSISAASTYSRGASKTVHGIAAVGVIEDSDGSTIYVPATGTPYPLRIEGHDGSDSADFDLTGWNVPFTAPRPPADEVVNLPH